MKTLQRERPQRAPRRQPAKLDFRTAGKRALRVRSGPDESCSDETEALSVAQFQGWFKLPMIEPKAVLPVLNKAGVDYVVLGLYGIAAWLKEPRATNDLDLLVPKGQHKKAVKALSAAFPDLAERDTEVVTRLLLKDRAVIDLIKPHHPLFVQALKLTRESNVGGCRAAVPVLEMAMALKFFAMTSPGREQGDQFQDAHDFIGMVRNNAEFDVDVLRRLGDLAYEGGGAELVKMAGDVRAGRRLEL